MEASKLIPGVIVMPDNTRVEIANCTTCHGQVITTTVFLGADSTSELYFIRTIEEEVVKRVKLAIHEMFRLELQMKNHGE